MRPEQCLPGIRAHEAGEGLVTIVECEPWVTYQNDCGVLVHVDRDDAQVLTSPAALTLVVE